MTTFPVQRSLVISAAESPISFFQRPLHVRSNVRRDHLPEQHLRNVSA